MRQHGLVAPINRQPTPTPRTVRSSAGICHRKMMRGTRFGVPRDHDNCLGQLISGDLKPISKPEFL
jgi:hypothetical protein